jgi:signal transduction histidine kinase
VSARAGEEATLEGLRAGADDYLVKPFTSRELFARITAKIASSKSTRALKESATAISALAEERGQLVERLEEAVRFAEQFVAILGHDLRNPLSAIQMNADLLKRDASHGRAVDRILSSTARITNMVGQLLDLTRSRLAGGIVVEPKSIALTDVVASAIDELRVIHPAREIRSALAPDLRGDWDPGRLAQVVSNLVDNALQYGDRSRPIEVRLVGRDAEAVLEVQSFGPPIAPELISVLFDPYRRGETRGSRRKGLGLGLHITRQIVAAHGGAIDVSSDAENGTIFAVRLPRASRRPASG